MRNFIGGLLGIIMVGALICIVLGWMKPVWTVWWTDDVDRWKSSGAYSGLFLLSLLLSGLIAPSESKNAKEIRQMVLEERELQEQVKTGGL